MEYNITNSPLELLNDLFNTIQDENFNTNAKDSLSRGELEAGQAFRRDLRKIRSICKQLRTESLKTSSRNREPF